jgi:predicted outer membrane repeat protein
MMKIPKASVFIFTLSVMLLICLSATAAEVEIVTTLEDVVSEDDYTSLREALSLVDNGGTISFDVTGVISLDSRLEITNKTVTIQGPGAEVLTIDGQDICRHFYIAGTASVDISGLSFVNGYGQNNISGVSGAHGGSIVNHGGDLSISDSSFSGNSSSIGGAISYFDKYQDDIDSLYIKNCDFEDNSAGTGQGGALASTASGELVIESSTFNGNSANIGGALYLKPGSGEEAYSSVLSCSFTNNSASNNGGAIYSEYGTLLSIQGSYFENNSSSNYGGAISLVNVTSANINSCVLSDNNADDNGGAIYSEGAYGFNPIISLKNSTINGNSAEYGGGIAAQTYSTFNLLNCTIADNSATGNGGGIKSLQNYSKINISNCTIYGNSRETSDIYGNAISNSGIMNLKNTIVACNTDGNGTTDNQIYNVPEENISFSITSDDVASSYLFFGDLADNGGPYVGPTSSEPMLTLMLHPDGPAIDAASSTDLDGKIVSKDQRGIERYQGNGYDMGAIEFRESDVVFHRVTVQPISYGGTIEPVSADVIENGTQQFTITPYPGYVLADLTLDGTSVFADVDEDGKYSLTNVTEPHTLKATFEIDSVMKEEAQTGSFIITGTTGTTNHPSTDDNPVEIPEESVRSLSIDPVSSNDVGTDLSETDFAAGVSVEIGFESPDEGIGVTQVDLELIITSTDLGAETFDAISQGEDLETAFFENASLYKVLDGQAYNLFNLAADHIGMDDVYDFFDVTEAGDAYKVAMTIVIADMAEPDGTEPVLALTELLLHDAVVSEQKPLFFVYDGNQDGKFTDPIVVMRKSADSVEPDEPVDTPDNPVEPDEPSNEPTTEGGTCSIGTFTPLAGLLVLPLLLMFKK